MVLGSSGPLLRLMQPRQQDAAHFWGVAWNHGPELDCKTSLIGPGASMRNCNAGASVLPHDMANSASGSTTILISDWNTILSSRKRLSGIHYRLWSS